MSTFPLFETPSINNISVIYWKDYINYCLNENNSDGRSSNISKLLYKLRSKDVLGPRCSKNWYKSIPIVELIPQEFKLDGIECRNYDLKALHSLKKIDVPSGFGTSMSLHDFCQPCSDDISMNDSLILNLDHESISNDEESIDSILNQMYTENINTGNVGGVKKPFINVYANLNPIFKELVSHLQENGSDETISRIKAFLSKELSNIRAGYNLKDNKKHPVGNMISFSCNYVKRRKPHGTNYFTKK